MSLMMRPEATCIPILVAFWELAIDGDGGGVIPTLDSIHKQGTQTSILSRHFYFGLLVTGSQT